MKDSMYDNMYKTETFHWWFKAKKDIVISLLSPYLEKDGSSHIIDFGCGCGLMLKELSKFGLVTGMDFSAEALTYCKQNFNGDLQQIDLSQPVQATAQYDLGIALDILEHIKNDSIAAKNFFEHMKPNGRLLITVPACQWLYSDHDKNCMHYRRYNKKEFIRCLKDAGFQIEFLSYYNFFLFPLAAIIRIISKIIPFDKNSSVENQYCLPVLNNLFYQIFRSESILLRRKLQLPIGLSLVALVYKPKDGAI